MEEAPYIEDVLTFPKVQHFESIYYTHFFYLICVLHFIQIKGGSQNPFQTLRLNNFFDLPQKKSLLQSNDEIL